MRTSTFFATAAAALAVLTLGACGSTADPAPAAAQESSEPSAAASIEPSASPGMEDAVKSGLRMAANEMETYYTDEKRYPTFEQVGEELRFSNGVTWPVTGGVEIVLKDLPTRFGPNTYCLTGTAPGVATHYYASRLPIPTTTPC